MEKIKKIMILIFQLLSLVALMVMLSKGGMAAVFGPEAIKYIKVIIEFGVAAMAIAGTCFGIFFPTLRHRVFRDSQLQIMKYISVLGLYQLLMFFMTSAAGSLGTGFIAQLPSVLVYVIILTFAMLAFMVPFNFIKSLFNLAKSVEYRDPRDLVRQLFK